VILVNYPDNTGRAAMRKIILSFIIWLAIQLTFNAQIPAQVYKYVDKDGVTHYTNAPSDRKYKKSKIGVNDPKKKNRPAVKKSPQYKKTPHPKKSSPSPH
jgi:hypothetical protein